MTDVLLIPSESPACASYRMLWPAAELPGVRIGRLTDDVLDGAVEADVVVIQRPQHRLLVQGIEKLRANGIRTVVELDDLFEELPEGHPVRPRLDPAENPDNNWAWTRRCVEVADELVCSTPGIADAYGKGTVVENAVPTAWLAIPHPFSPRLRVGWTGDPRQHVGDLEQAAGAVQSVCPPCVPSIVGARAAFGYLGVNGLYTGFVDLKDYPSAIANAVDVGIAPLAPNRFNECKSWNKPLEYAALGIPHVASKSPEYARLDLPGVRLAADRVEWTEALRALVRTPIEELAETGRRLRDAVVERGLTVEQNARKFLSAWIGGIA